VPGATPLSRAKEIEDEEDDEGRDD
jgi:hypothetical protein